MVIGVSQTKRKKYKRDKPKIRVRGEVTKQKMESKGRGANNGDRRASAFAPQCTASVVHQLSLQYCSYAGEK